MTELQLTQMIIDWIGDTEPVDYEDELSNALVNGSNNRIVVLKSDAHHLAKKILSEIEK